MFARRSALRLLALCGLLVGSSALRAAPTLPPDLEASLTQKFGGFSSTHGSLFEVLDPNDYRHPYERRVVSELMKDPKVLELLPEATELCKQINTEYHHQHLMQGVVCSPTQFPEIYKMAQENAAALRMKPGFKIYVMNAAQMNAYTWSIDQDNYGVALYSSIIKALTPDELRYVLAHEMGHVKSKHVLYGVLLQLYAKKYDALPKVMQLSGAEAAAAAGAKKIPLAGILESFVDMPRSVVENIVLKAGGKLRPLMVTDKEQANFQRLQQANEYSSDRAGMVASGKRKEAMMGLVKLASGDMGDLSGFDLDAYLKQIDSVLDGMSAQELEGMMQGEGSHAFTLMRVGELGRFFDSDEFQHAANTQGTSIFTRIVSAYYQVASDLIPAAEQLKKFREGTTTEELNALERRLQEKKLTEAVLPRQAALEAMLPVVVDPITGLGLDKDNTAFDLMMAYAKARKVGKPMKAVGDKLIQQIQFELQKPDLTPDQKSSLESKLAALKALLKLGATDDDAK